MDKFIVNYLRKHRINAASSPQLETPKSWGYLTCKLFLKLETGLEDRWSICHENIGEGMSDYFHRKVFEFQGGDVEL